MSKTRIFLKFWLPAIIWMAIIFSASSDAKSGQHSSRIIEPVLRWLFPHIEQATVTVTVIFVRKCAHLTEYAILALLLWRAFRKPIKNDRRPWSWREAGLALFCVAIYAATDEFHQAFVPTREASVWDVLVDTAGGATGLILLWAVRNRFKRSQKSKSSS